MEEGDSSCENQMLQLSLPVSPSSSESMLKSPMRSPHKDDDEERPGLAQIADQVNLENNCLFEFGYFSCFPSYLWCCCLCSS